MASLIFSDCSSSTMSRLIHSNIRNGGLLSRWCFGQVRLRTTATRRGCTLSIRSSSSSPTPDPDIYAMVIDGTAENKKIADDTRIEVSRMKESIGVVSGLAVILVGDRKYSSSYVRRKKKACESVGIKSFEVYLSEDSSEEEVLKSVSGFNDDPCCDNLDLGQNREAHGIEPKGRTAIFDLNLNSPVSYLSVDNTRGRGEEAVAHQGDKNKTEQNQYQKEKPLPPASDSVAGVTRGLS